MVYTIGNITIENKNITENSYLLTQEFYEQEKDTVATLVALSIMEELYENNLISEKEYKYIKDKYNLE